MKDDCGYTREDLVDSLTDSEGEVDRLISTLQRETTRADAAEMENTILRARIDEMTAISGVVEQAKLDAANAQGAQAQAEQEREIIVNQLGACIDEREREHGRKLLAEHERNEARTQLAEDDQLLRDLEWSSYTTDDFYGSACPACKMAQAAGHVDACRLAVRLRLKSPISPRNNA